MTQRFLHVTTAVVSMVLLVGSACAQSTAPFTAEELEAVYATAISKRTTAIVELLNLTDPAKSNRVHEIIMAQYRSLRARDEAIDPMLRQLEKTIPGAETNRLSVVRMLSRPLHEKYLARLSAELAPEQVEKVKDRMTYNKVRVTYDAYCGIVPGLNDTEKARILALLKEAREEAMDGGSADEKSAIFQQHKDRINAYLNANGHDVAKAIKDWEARQEQATVAK